MNPHAFLVNLALVLGVAAVTTVICRRVHIPIVFGYLVAGMVLGPHVPIPLVADREIVVSLAELGVILLMFSLGLEFSFKKIARVGLPAVLTAMIETSFVGWLGYLAGRFLGWSARECLFIAAAVAISSTTIVVKAFDELRIGGRLRETVLGILVVEDLVAILLLAVLTSIGAGADPSGATIGAIVTRLIGFILAVVVIGLLIVPRLIRMIIRLNRPETTVVASIGLCFVLALLADRAGHSVALGAFLAGALVAESGETREIERLVHPIRDVFAAIFFVAVGMLINPAIVAAHLGAIATLTVIVVIGKICGISLGAFLSGRGLRTSVRAGMSMAQIGEFSFIIASVGLASGATRDFLYPIAVAVSAVTTLFTPWLIQASAPIATYVDRRLPGPLQTFATLYGSWIENLSATAPSSRTKSVKNNQRLVGLLLIDAGIIAGIAISVSLVFEDAATTMAQLTGFGTKHARLAVVAMASFLSIPFVIGIAGIARRLGANASELVLPRPDRHGLDTGAVPRRLLALSIQMLCLIAVGGPLVALTQPFLPTAAVALVLGVLGTAAGLGIWRGATDLEGHVQAGAQVVAAALAKAAKKGMSGDSLDIARRLLPGIGEPAAIPIEAGDYAVGRTLVEINLRGATGATALAISRGIADAIRPTGRESLLIGDVLALAGSHEAIGAARLLLHSGKIE